MVYFALAVKLSEMPCLCHPDRMQILLAFYCDHVVILLNEDIILASILGQAKDRTKNVVQIITAIQPTSI